MRGGISYVALMVLNPIIILFYQNCSVLPTERAMAQRPPTVEQSVNSRAPASIKVESLKNCDSANLACPKPLE